MGLKDRLYAAVDKSAREEQRAEREEELRRRLRRNKERIAQEEKLRGLNRKAKGSTVNYLKSVYRQRELERQNYHIESDLDPSLKAKRKEEKMRRMQERQKKYQAKIDKVNRGIGRFNKGVSGFQKSLDGLNSSFGGGRGGRESGLGVDVNELVFGGTGHRRKGRKGRSIESELLGGMKGPSEKDLLGF